jgi:hypothetical protein
MGAAPSTGRSISESATAANLSPETARGISESRAALEQLTSKIGERHAVSITESVLDIHRQSSRSLEVIERFLTDPRLKHNLSEFRAEFGAALDQARELQRAIPHSAVAALSAEEHHSLSQALTPITEHATRFHSELRTHRSSLERTVLENQENLRIRTGLNLLRDAVVDDLTTELKKIRMLTDTREKIISFVLDRLIYPYAEPLIADPARGELNTASLNAALEDLAKSRRIDIAPGKMILLDETLGTPRILRAIGAVTARFASDAELLSRSSLARHDRNPDIDRLDRPGSTTAAHGLTFNFDYRWDADPKGESCVVTLSSPWGDRGKYRCLLAPVRGEEILFRSAVAGLHRDCEALGTMADPSKAAFGIEQRLHRLGGAAEVITQPVTTVEGFLRESRIAIVNPLNEEAVREGIRATLSQSFSLKPLRIGSEGADDGRINRVGLEIRNGTVNLRLFRQGYDGIIFGSAPSVTLKTRDTGGAREILRGLEGMLRDSHGSLNSDAGRTVLTKLLHAEGSSLTHGANLFEVVSLRNVKFDNYEGLTVRLGPGANVTNVIVRGSAITFQNTATVSELRPRLSSVAADEKSIVNLALSGAELTGLSIHSGTIRCRNCVAEDVAIRRLGRDSVAVWNDPENGNHFRDPARNRISRSIANRISELFGEEESYTMWYQVR